MLLGGIEAGGTKFVCAVGDEKGNIIEKVSFPTRNPEETLNDVKEFFNHHPIEALGVGSFGPIDLNKDSTSYGMILNTPKIKWKNYNLLGSLKKDFDIPIFIDTDVNAACSAEYKYGAGRDVGSCLYITVGTGIGAGLVQDGRIFQGKNHSEMGHIFVRQHPDDPFEGGCPYHRNCLEGLASGPAIEARYGTKGALLVDNENVWEMEAYYLAQAIMNYTVTLYPERIIVGGGVLKQEGLYPLIRRHLVEMMNGYIDVGEVDKFIVAPELGDAQGVRGAMSLVVL
ncbi:ROK family protein [Oceanobacillus massiliensis]|uniref:ROK family protein n=1 Tax=Oceanobacillus massiliensis TaxID=1465765 RepID=UPI000287D30A|nr:ROK family protein [Oceanobacillus massiliensis]